MTARQAANWKFFMLVAPTPVDEIGDIRFGVTADLASRIEEIQHDLSPTIEKVCFVHVGEYQAALGVEKKVLDALKRLRTHGNWIRVDMDNPMHATALKAALDAAIRPLLGTGWKWQTADFCANQSLVSRGAPKKTA